MAATETRHHQPKPVDREKLQRRALWLMFAMAMLTLISVSIYRFSGAEPLAQPPTPPIAAERLVLLERQGRDGVVLVRDAETGVVLTDSGQHLKGFIDTIARVVDRQRLVDGTTPDAPLRIVRFDSGRISLIDAESGWRIEITGHGDQNVAAISGLLEE